MEDLKSFPETARIWIYQGAHTVPAADVARVREAIHRFAADWTSHNVMLKSWGELLYDRFVVLAVNEMHAGVSGCSIDASVQFIRSLGQQLGIDFMDRLQFAYLTEQEEVHTVHKDALPQLFANGSVDDNTPFFNNLVQSKADFESKWLVPLGESWMKRFV